MKITIIQEDIDNGKAGSAFHCPISNAVNRLYPTAKNNSYEYQKAVTGPFWIRHGNLSQRESYALPEEAIKFIYNFDTGNYVEPITFIAKRCEE